MLHDCDLAEQNDKKVSSLSVLCLESFSMCKSGVGLCLDSVLRDRNLGIFVAGSFRFAVFHVGLMLGMCLL